MSTLILGCGYTGRFLANELQKSGFSRSMIAVTRRTESPERHSIPFNLSDRDSWKNISRQKFEITYWLFSAEPLTVVQDFWQEMKSHLGKIIVVGSTSGFLTSKPGERVIEESPLNLKIPRVESEEFLRKEGATVVRAAGIYGLGRDPRNWMKKGLICAGNSWLNLIHVEDLARLLMAASMAPSGLHWIASDGNPLRWNTIVERLKLEVPSSYDSQLEKPESKVIDSTRTWRESQILPRYRDLFEGIHSLYDPRGE